MKCLLKKKCFFLTAAQTCALLSTFVCDEKSSQLPKLGEELSGPLRQMQDIARRIARVSHECKLEVRTFQFSSFAFSFTR